MADFSDAAKRQLGYFHGLSKTPTEENQNVYESQYKSSHTVRLNEVWADEVAWAADIIAADAEAIANPAVTKYTLNILTEIPGSNGQSWYLNDSGLFVRPFISPVDVPHTVTNLPSHGYQLLLYRNDETLITPTEGSWNVDYYAGIIKFAEGYTPFDLGWGVPKVTVFVYTGQSSSTSLSVKTENFVLTTTDISNKYVELSSVPQVKEKVLIFVEGGMKGELDVDYTLVLSRIDWNGLLWENLLAVNDKLTIYYW